MTLQELIAKYTDQHCEVAGSATAKNQCVDLANAKIRDVDGLPIIEWTNAVDFPERGSKDYDFIANTPDGVPQIGDLIIFKQYGKLYGSAGHIGIVVYADSASIKVFEQNYPTEGTVCRIGTHNYLGCRGWMRPKPRINGYASVFIKYGYPATLPTEALDIIFTKYHEWRDKLQLGELLTKGECDQKLQDAKISLQRNEVYRGQLAKVLFNDETAGWDKILESVPAIIRESDSDKKPAKAAHELFTKVNEIYHNVYVYPEDVSTTLSAFYDLYITQKKRLEVIDAEQVAQNKEEVINVTPEPSKSFIDNLVEFWRSIWKKQSSV